MGWWPRIGLWRVPAAVTLVALFCCAEAWGATQWVGRPYSVTLVAHIAGAGQTSEGSTTLTLTHDDPCTVSVSVAQAGDEFFRLGGPGGPTLDTSYKLTGIADQDADWLSPAAFLSRTYNVPGSGLTEHLTLSVRAAAPTTQAPEAGNYQATIILTVTF
jgi:hypothetical protein